MATQSALPMLELHEHACRSCGSAFNCVLPNRLCPTLCKSCHQQERDCDAAFYVWWGTGDAVEFIAEFQRLRSQNQFAPLAHKGFAAGYLAARKDMK